MTVEEFLEFYPKFGSLPRRVLDNYAEKANARFGMLGEDAEEARRLYMAHWLTLYRRASEADDPRLPLSKKVGEVSVAYRAEAVDGSGLTMTVFGRQLRMLLRGTTAYVP